MKEALDKIDTEISSTQSECRHHQDKVDYLVARLGGLLRARDIMQDAYDRSQPDLPAPVSGD